MTTPSDKSRLTRYARRTFADKVTAPPAVAEPPADPRPRFGGRHAYAGRLKDPRERFFEEWGGESEINDLLLDPLVDPATKAAAREAANFYLERFAAADRDAAAEATRANDLKATAERLGLDPAKFASADWRQANAQLIGAADERVRDREAAAELAAKLERPLPEPVE